MYSNDNCDLIIKFVVKFELVSIKNEFTYVNVQCCDSLIIIITTQPFKLFVSQFYFNFETIPFSFTSLRRYTFRNFKEKVFFGLTVFLTFIIFLTKFPAIFSINKKLFCGGCHCLRCVRVQVECKGRNTIRHLKHKKWKEIETIF